MAQSPEQDLEEVEREFEWVIKHYEDKVAQIDVEQQEIEDQEECLKQLEAEEQAKIWEAKWAIADVTKQIAELEEKHDKVKKCKSTNAEVITKKVKKLDKLHQLQVCFYGFHWITHQQIGSKNYDCYQICVLNVFLFIQAKVQQMADSPLLHVTLSSSEGRYSKQIE